MTKQDCRTFTWPLQANQALVRLNALPKIPMPKNRTPLPAVELRVPE